MKIINNIKTSSIYYTIDNGVESKINPEEEKIFADFELSLGKSCLSIYWKNGYNQNNFIIHDKIQCNDGIYTIIAPYRIPKLTFQPFNTKKDTYCDEEYRMVGEEIKNLSHGDCYKNNCSCLGGRDNKHNPHILVANLMYLIDHGPLTEEQLKTIINDMFN